MRKLTISLAGLIYILFAISAHAQTNPEQARNFQINEAHTGASASSISPPLIQKWSVNFGQPISYPLIADGRVFVTVKNEFSYGTKLYALNAADGSTLWSFDLGSLDHWSGLCYENGRVFAVTSSGWLAAFNGASGSLLWSQALSNSQDSPPTVFQGVIYIATTGNRGIYAVSADTGAVLWSHAVPGGAHGAPAVASDGLYVSHLCADVFKYNLTAGDVLWDNYLGCAGGSGATTALYQGRLYVRENDPDYILDSQSGAIMGSFLSKSVPAFSGNLGFFLNGPKSFGSYGVLEARDVNTNIAQWTFAGDGHLQSSVIVVNGYVYVGSDQGNLYAVEAATGNQAWSVNTGNSIPYVNEQDVSQPLTGFAAGEGIIVIPTQTTLVAYETNNLPTITWDAHYPAANADGWNNTQVQLYFTPQAHPSGIVSASPGSPLYFNSEGRNQTQQVTVTDTTHNKTATITSPTVNIDLTYPVTTKSFSGTCAGGVTWYCGPGQHTLTGSDALSGIRNIFYAWDNGPVQTYTGAFSNSVEGTHHLYYWSEDVAGNRESSHTDFFTVDLTPPSTQAAVSGTSADGWYANPAQVSLTATDDSIGVQQTFFTVDGGPTQTYVNPFSIAGEGNHVVAYWSVDRVGNSEPAHSLTVKVDASAPSTQLTITGTAGNSGWYVSPSVQVALTGSDGLSGVATTYYSVDGGAVQTYAGPFTLNASAQNQINFWSVDKVGNTETQRSSTVKIDNVGPTTQSSVSGTSSNGYFNGQAQVSLSASDNLSGVATTYYRVDGGAVQTYSQAFSISGDGTHAVEFWSVDVAGNNAVSSTINVLIDATAPTTQAALSGTMGGAGWYSAPVQVTLTANDNLSGVANTYYAIDGGGLQTYSAPFTIADTGTHTVLFWSKDQANNAESQQSLTIKVDLSAPATQATISGNSNNGWYQNPQISLSASDGGSGVADTFYTIDGGTTRTYSAPFSVAGGGNHIVAFWSVDAAGNNESHQSLTVQIDTDAPVTQLSSSGTNGNGGWYRGPVQISLAGADTQSGLANSFYSVDGGPTQTYASAFTINTDGQHSVSFWSVDRLGNSETQQNALIKIDQTGSTAQIAVTGTTGGGNYFVTPAQVSLTAADNLSGVAAIYYRIDGGAAQAYTSAFMVSVDGTHTIDYWSVDVAGNNQNSYASTIRIDRTAPLSVATPSGTAGTNGWFRSAVQLSLAASDNASGVQSTYYRIDGGAAFSYSTPLTLSALGNHTLNFWSLDVAGNTEGQRALAVNIDNTAPVLTETVKPATAGHGNKPVTVTISGQVTDSYSGVLANGSVTYSVLDEYGVTQPSGGLTLQSNGTYSFTLSLPATKNPGDTNGHLYTITIQATDQAGNVSTASGTLKIT